MTRRDDHSFRGSIGRPLHAWHVVISGELVRLHVEEPAELRVRVVLRDAAVAQAATDPLDDPYPVAPEEEDQHDRRRQVGRDALQLQVRRAVDLAGDAERALGRAAEPAHPGVGLDVAGIAAEHLLQAYAGAYGLDVIALRFCNLFGRGLYVAGSSGGEAFNEPVEEAVAGETARILPPLLGRSEWLYAKDAARALAAAVARTDEGGFTVVNVGRWTKADPEDALRKMIKRFTARFKQIEEAARVTGRPIEEMTIEEMDAVWDRAKQGTANRE